MDDEDIILTDDIVLCETDAPYSLPPVLTPLPNTPSSALAPYSGPLLFTSTVSTGIGGACAVGAEGGGGEGRSLGVEVCRKAGCGAQKACLWHRFVLNYPHYVVWHPSTKTVTLEKSAHPSFGFKYKIKMCDGPPAELYALVVEVVNGGAAWNLLLPGDWIRSMNGTPVSTAKEAFKLDFRTLKTLRLVIQRPEALSRKGTTRLKQQAQSLGIRLHVPLPPADSLSPGPSPQLSSLTPSPQPFSLTHSPQPSSPAPIDIRRPSPQLGNQRHQFATPWENEKIDYDACADVGWDPHLDQYPRKGFSPGEHIPLDRIGQRVSCNAEREKCVLPYVRIVVCGAHGSAVQFVRALVSDCPNVTIDPDANVQRLCVAFSRSADGTFRTLRQQDSLNSLAQNWQARCTSECCGDDAGRERALNVELYVFNDVDFYHHCAAWLLSSCALVLLTFPVEKLLNQPEPETQRLALMVQTLRGSVTRQHRPSTMPRVLMFGVPPSSQQDISAEEVQAIFYVTDYGARLLEHRAVTVPSVVALESSASLNLARAAVFASCEKRAREVLVQQSTVPVACALRERKEVVISQGEVSEVVRRVTGSGGDSAEVHSVIADLLTTDCIICGQSRDSDNPDSASSDYLLPAPLFDAISKLLIKPDLIPLSLDAQQKWFHLVTTARTPRADIHTILATELSPLTTNLLERLGLAFGFQSSKTSSQGDSGYGEDCAEYVFPYFLMDAGENGEILEEGGLRLVARFEGGVWWRDFYAMLSRMSRLPGTEEARLVGPCRCLVRHDGMELRLLWRRSLQGDALCLTASRPNHRGGQQKVVIQQVERLLSSVLPASTPFNLLSGEHFSFTSDQASVPAARPKVAIPVDQEDTLVKTVVESKAVSATGAGGCGSCLMLSALPWSAVKKAAILLSSTMATEHDWRSVAEKAGKSVPEIMAYESVKSGEVAAMAFLREWVLVGTVQEFLDILQDLDRQDVHQLVLENLPRNPESDSQ